MILNEMARYTDFLTMGAQTTGVSLIDFNKTASTLNGLGLVYKMYGDHFPGAIPVALSGNSPQPAPKYPAGSPDQPEKSSGSPTYPLDMYAALSPDRKYLIVSVVNATESEQKANLSVTRRTSGRAIHTVAIDRGQSRRRQPCRTAGPACNQRIFHRGCSGYDHRCAHQRQHLSISHS